MIWLLCAYSVGVLLMVGLLDEMDYTMGVDADEREQIVLAAVWPVLVIGATGLLFGYAIQGLRRRMRGRE